MFQLTPIVDQPELYITYFFGFYSSPTRVFITNGQCRDSNNLMDLFLQNGIEIKADSNGVNGLDTGTLSPNTFYYAYVIGSSANKVPTAVILSANNNAPILPFGYDSFRFVSFHRTDGSANFVLSYEAGDGKFRTKIWASPILISGTGGTTSPASLNLNSGVPFYNTENGIATVYLNVIFTADTAGNTVSFTDGASTPGISTPTVTGPVISQAQTAQIKVTALFSGSGYFVNYVSSSATDTIVVYVDSFDYSL